MKHLLFLLLLMCPIKSEAQIRLCGNEALQQRFKNYPKSVRNVKPIAIERQQVTIAVVVHIVWNKPDENLCDEIIFSQIEALNRDFSGQNLDNDLVPNEFKAIKSGDTGIRFCLASFDPHGLPSIGIVRTYTHLEEAGVSDSLFYTNLGGSDAWDTEKYLNIWVANTGKFISGFGTYPGFTPIEKNGVVIHPKYFGTHPNGRFNLGRTTVHEIGHYLGLLHPWAGGDCGIADSIADTPAQSNSFSGCPDYPQYSCGQSIAFMNYMDYVDDPCMVIFTKGQKDFMRATLETLRPTLGTNQIDLCSSGNANIFDFEIYPNPAREEIKLEMRSPLLAKIYSIQILNSMGQTISASHCIKSNFEVQVELNSIGSGIYFVRVDNIVKAFIKL